MALLVAACGNNGTNTADDDGGGTDRGRQQLLMGGSTSGSTGYAYTVAFANLMNREIDGLNIQVQETAGTIDGVTQIKNGNLDLAVSVGDVSVDALEGKGPFEDIGAVDNLRQVMNLYATPYNLIVAEDSNIQSVEDFEGATIGAGAPGSGSHEMLRQLLRLHDIDEGNVNIQPIAPAEQGDAFRNGQLDVMAFQGGAGTGWVQELSRARDLRWLDLSDDVLDAMNEERGDVLVSATIPADAYDGLDNDVTTVATVVQWVTTEDLDEDLVYEMWEVFWEHKDELDGNHQVIRETTPEFASDPAFIPWHPGAERYIEENDLGQS